MLIPVGAYTCRCAVNHFVVTSHSVPGCCADASVLCRAVDLVLSVSPARSVVWPRRESVRAVCQASLCLTNTRVCWCKIKQNIQKHCPHKTTLAPQIHLTIERADQRERERAQANRQRCFVFSTSGRFRDFVVQHGGR